MAMAAAVAALFCAGERESALGHIGIGVDKPSLLVEGPPPASPRLSSGYCVDDDRHAPCEFLTLDSGDLGWLVQVLLGIIAALFVEKITILVGDFWICGFFFTNNYYIDTVLPMVLMRAPYRFTVVVFGYITWYIAFAGALTVPFWPLVTMKLVHQLLALPSWIGYVRAVWYLSICGRILLPALLKVLLLCHRHQSMMKVIMASSFDFLGEDSAAAIAAHAQPPPRRRLRRADLAKMPRRVLFA